MVTAMGEQLKRSLQAERTSKPSEEVTSESPQHSSDSDVTSIDLFEPIKKQPFIRKCSQNNIFVTSEEEEDEEEEDEEEDNGILPQKEPACQQHPQKVWVELDQDTLEALKEMPRLVATMKAALDEISGSSSSGSCSSSGDSQQTGRNTGSNDLMFLGNSSVQVSTRLFQRLGNRRMSLFTQELATLIFGNETLAKSTLTGKGKSAETLDPEKVNAIIDTVRGKYPGTEVSAIRALLRRKCNNESYKTNIPPK
ncbi:Protein insensitive [Dissostichus eleginoides]|uniref:Protein insensitive n=1 Tax=Dissostichus eleginoides TaxID=100907 RepID=A0AAD9CRK3_DISEL|nr:Protein insensitive [Dissostichus eleginoides]